jgi:hypothetical protein
MPIRRLCSQSLSACLSAALLLCVAGAESAHATATYKYVGNNFTTASAPYSTADKITATLVLTDVLGPDLAFAGIGALIVQWDFTAGAGVHHSFDGSTSQCSNGRGFSAGTDSSGVITDWNFIFADDGCGQRLSTKNGAGGTPIDQVSDEPVTMILGNVSGNPGSWTLVPEPSTLSLTALGLLGLAATRRRCAAG